jgi:predicted permease
MAHFLRQDLLYVIRQLRKSPGFAAAVVLTLALGIGANLTVFLILYGVILKPLPFPEPQQLVRINRFYPDGTTVPAYSGTKALFLRRASRTLESAAAYDYIPSHVNLLQGNQVMPLEALRVTSDFFRVFQMEPRLGRGFTAADMVPNAPAVAVLSDSTWRQQFGADPNVLGRSITLGNKPYAVIGVAHPVFQLDNKVNVWVPLPIVEAPDDQANDYNLVGRMKPGVTREQAQDDLKRVLLELKSIYPALWDRQESLRVFDFHDSLTGPVRPALEMLMGAVALVLIIVSANVLSLLLTRSIARRREMGLRAALGASSWRLLRQLLVENAVLCVLGGLLGVMLANFAMPLLMHLSPLPLPQFANLNFGASACFFSLGLVFGCALLFSAVPAWESRRLQLNESLRMNTTQIAAGRNLAQKSLVVGEVAVSLVLLIASALLLSSFWKLMHVSPGFDPTNVLTFKTSFTDEQASSSAALGRRMDEIVARLQAQPGVQAAAATNSLPTQLTPDLPFEILGRKPGSPDASGDEKYMPITADYFTAMRIPVVSGRSFRISDTHGTEPVVIINQEVARAFFKGQSAIGQHILIGRFMGPGFEDSVREIVGVVGDTRSAGLDQPVPGIMYLPAAQIPDSLTKMNNGLLGMSWVVRTRTAGANVADAARRILMDNARTPLLSIETMQNVISASVAQQRFTMMLLGCFGLISLLMGGAGLYGVMSYSVARRTKEIGVRMAIGARRADILRMMLGEAGLLVCLGLTIGLVASLAGAQILRSLLYGIAPRDPLTIAAMCGLLLLTGLFAAWWPASRAASTEPMQALRAE